MKIDQDKLIEFLQDEMEYEKGELERAKELESLEIICYYEGWLDALKYVLKSVECNTI